MRKKNSEEKGGRTRRIGRRRGRGGRGRRRRRRRRR